MLALRDGAALFVNVLQWSISVLAVANTVTSHTRFTGVLFALDQHPGSHVGGEKMGEFGSSMAPDDRNGRHGLPEETKSNQDRNCVDEGSREGLLSRTVESPKKDMWYVTIGGYVCASKNKRFCVSVGYMPIKSKGRTPTPERCDTRGEEREEKSGDGQALCREGNGCEKRYTQACKSDQNK